MKKHATRFAAILALLVAMVTIAGDGCRIQVDETDKTYYGTQAR